MCSVLLCNRASLIQWSQPKAASSRSLTLDWVPGRARARSSQSPIAERARTYPSDSATLPMEANASASRGRTGIEVYWLGARVGVVYVVVWVTSCPNCGAARLHLR
jgi:hypothetical protein